MLKFTPRKARLAAALLTIVVPLAAPRSVWAQQPIPYSAAGCADLELPSGPPPWQEELELLWKTIQEQQKQIEELRGALAERQPVSESLRRGVAANTAATDPSSTATGVHHSAYSVPPQQDLGTRVARVEQDLAETRTAVEERVRGFGPFTFSGDLRVRYEPFFGGGMQGAATPESRHRERYRLRFNATARFDDEFSGGLRLASGDPGDPISTNQTLTGFFVRKPFLVDRAYVNYRPRWLQPLQLTAGKWGYTWYRTELTWDNDVNPEGISESVGFNWNDNFLRRLYVVAFQMPFFEVSGAGDSAVFGGQVQADWNLNRRVKLGTYLAYYDFHNPGPIAANLTGGLGAFSSGTSTSAGGRFGFSGGSFTNYSGTINSVRTFASNYGIVDAVARLDFDTGSSRFPLMMQLNFAQNTRACQNLGAFTAAGVPAPECNPRERQAYWAEAQFGRTQDKGDLRLGYTFIRIERDAVLSSFNFSDLRQPTNVVNHRMEAFYQLNRKTTVGLTGLIGRQLGQVPGSGSATPARERFLKRFQFDLIYSF